MKSEKKARGKARENTRHVTAWIMAGLLVAGLVPVLPEASRALAKDTDVVVELGGDDVPSLDSQAINVYDQTAEVDSGFAAREMEPMAGVASFSDVTAQTAHQEDISWLASSGISKGWDMPDGTVTETELSFPYALRAGSLEIIKVKMNDDGSVSVVGNAEVGVTVTLDWKEGNTQELITG